MIPPPYYGKGSRMLATVQEGNPYNKDLKQARTLQKHAKFFDICFSRLSTLHKKTLDDKKKNDDPNSSGDPTLIVEYSRQYQKTFDVYTIMIPLMENQTKLGNPVPDTLMVKIHDLENWYVMDNQKGKIDCTDNDNDDNKDGDDKNDTGDAPIVLSQVSLKPRHVEKYTKLCFNDDKIKEEEKKKGNVGKNAEIINMIQVFNEQTGFQCTDALKSIGFCDMFFTYIRCSSQPAFDFTSICLELKAGPVYIASLIRQQLQTSSTASKIIKSSIVGLKYVLTGLWQVVASAVNECIILIAQGGWKEYSIKIAKLMSKGVKQIWGVKKQTDNDKCFQMCAVTRRILEFVVKSIDLLMRVTWHSAGDYCRKDARFQIAMMLRADPDLAWILVFLARRDLSEQGVMSDIDTFMSLLRDIFESNVSFFETSERYHRDLLDVYSSDERTIQEEMNQYAKSYISLFATMRQTGHSASSANLTPTALARMHEQRTLVQTMNDLVVPRTPFGQSMMEEKLQQEKGTEEGERKHQMEGKEEGKHQMDGKEEGEHEVRQRARVILYCVEQELNDRYLPEEKCTYQVLEDDKTKEFYTHVCKRITAYNQQVYSSAATSTHQLLTLYHNSYKHNRKSNTWGLDSPSEDLETILCMKMYDVVVDSISTEIETAARNKIPSRKNITHTLTYLEHAWKRQSILLCFIEYWNEFTAAKYSANMSHHRFIHKNSQTKEAKDKDHLNNIAALMIQYCERRFPIPNSPAAKCGIISFENNCDVAFENYTVSMFFGVLERYLYVVDLMVGKLMPSLDSSAPHGFSLLTDSPCVSQVDAIRLVFVIANRNTFAKETRMFFKDVWYTLDIRTPRFQRMKTRYIHRNRSSTSRLDEGCLSWQNKKLPCIDIGTYQSCPVDLTVDPCPSSNSLFAPGFMYSQIAEAEQIIMKLIVSQGAKLTKAQLTMFYKEFYGTRCAVGLTAEGFNLARFFATFDTPLLAFSKFAKQKHDKSLRACPEIPFFSQNPSTDNVFTAWINLSSLPEENNTTREGTLQTNKRRRLYEGVEWFLQTHRLCTTESQMLAFMKMCPSIVYDTLGKLGRLALNNKAKRPLISATDVPYDYLTRKVYDGIYRKFKWVTIIDSTINAKPHETLESDINAIFTAIDINHYEVDDKEMPNLHKYIIKAVETYLEKVLTALFVRP
jgi:hypothetical protein